MLSCCDGLKRFAEQTFSKSYMRVSKSLEGFPYPAHSTREPAVRWPRACTVVTEWLLNLRHYGYGHEAARAKPGGIHECALREQSTVD